MTLQCVTAEDVSPRREFTKEYPNPARALRRLCVRVLLSELGERSMQRPRKPNSARKPPEPTESHVDVEEWMRRRVMPDLQPIVERLDSLIRDTIPELHYAIKWKNAYYGVRELGWVIELVSYDVSVNVVFFGGAEFDSPPPLGTTDRSRYVKLRSVEETQRPEIQRWIEQAGQVAGWM